METKRKVMVLVVILGLIATTFVIIVFTGSRAHDAQISLTFQRYSDILDARAGDVAFLWLTNASTNAYRLSMTGNRYTLVSDTGFGRYMQSWMVNCEFSDQTTSGWTNWTQLPSASRGS